MTIKRFELYRDSAEFKHQDDVFPGCVAGYTGDRDPELIAAFDTKEEALKELAKYESTVKKNQGWGSVRFTWVEEYWVEENEYEQDEDGELEWIEIWGVVDWSRMDFPEEEEEE